MHVSKQCEQKGVDFRVQEVKRLMGLKVHQDSRSQNGSFPRIVTGEYNGLHETKAKAMLAAQCARLEIV